RAEGDDSALNSCTAISVTPTVTAAVENMAWGMVWDHHFDGAVVLGILALAGDTSLRLQQAINYILQNAPELRPQLLQGYGDIMLASWPTGGCGGVSFDVM